MKFIKQIIVIPLIILRDLLSFIPIYNKLNVMRWICLVTDSADDALAYIAALLSQFEPEEFEEAVIEQTYKYKDARFACAICTTYYNQGKLDKSKHVLEIALNAGCSNPEHLLLIRYIHVDKKSAEFDEILEQMLTRRDISPSYSRLAWTIKCWQYVETSDMTNAVLVADRLLEIEDNPMALLTKWVTVFEKDPACAQVYFEKANKAWTFEHFDAVVAEGWHILGDHAKAAAHLKKAISEGFNYKNEDKTSGKIFDEIINSQEFAQA